MGRREKRESKKNVGSKLFIISIIILILIAAGLLAGKFLKKNNSNDSAINADEDVQDNIIEENGIKIFQGNDRPIAVVMENSTSDDWPQPGLQDAYLVYEMTVEGGLTKLMALYKGMSVDKIGYIRSARPYFIDYALENDAVLVHYGHSTAAANDEAALKIDYIDGLNLSSSDKTFTTVQGKTTGGAKRIVASTESIKAKMEGQKIRTTSTDEGLNYVADDYELGDVVDNTGNITNIANSVNITYSTAHSVSYTYDAETKLYKRFQNRVPHVTTDNVQLTAKNIIVQFANETPLTGEYIQITTVGTGTGYYITNGKYIEITWKKDSRAARTQYFDKDGNEIKINDGVTYVQITPKGQKVTFE